jgi:hypothetical protein
MGPQECNRSELLGLFPPVCSMGGADMLLGLAFLRPQYKETIIPGVFEAALVPLQPQHAGDFPR